MIYPLIGMPEGWEWLVILVIVLLVFGARKLPDIARNSGQALRIFKSETRSLKDDDKQKKAAELEAKQADLAARQAELDAEREKLNDQHGDNA
jgi:sec-independent protein translocase protein TatA